MKIIQIPKKNKKEYRTIYVPDKDLKKELQELLPSIEKKCRAKLKSEKLTHIVHGFIHNKSPVTNALQHVGYAYTLNIDLEDFFDSVRPEHVNKFLPNDVIEKCFYDNAPRQGLPTSPIIANIAGVNLDKAILRFTKKKNIEVTYTRYADDLTFSFNKKSYKDILLNQLKHIVPKCGFKINTKKIRLQSQNYGNREVTGVMVNNNDICVSRKFKRKMRAAAYQENEKTLRGMQEWQKLKLPGNNTKKNEQQDTLNSLTKNKRGRIVKKSFQIRPLYEVADNDFLLTNDYAYIWGMSDLARGWTSCFKKNGQNGNTPVFLSQFNVYVGLILDKEYTGYYGLKRKGIKARCILYEVKETPNVLIARSFYAANLCERDKLQKHLIKVSDNETNSYKILVHSTKEEKELLSAHDGKLTVKGYGRIYKTRCCLYDKCIKKRVKLKNRNEQYEKIILR